MIALSTILPLGGIGLLAGTLIGCIGVGGVILVPALVYLGGVEVHVAIASCMLSYLFSGGLGAIMYARRGSIRWSMASWLCVGAMPGAFLGAAALSLAPGKLLELIIAVLVIFAGVNALLKRAASSGEACLGHGRLAAIGLVSGFGSALSGTGGPLILVPLLVWLQVPALTAVGLSQVIQVPIAVLATIGNVTYGHIDWGLGTAIAVLLMLGVVLGARIAHAVPAATLRRVVAGVLVVVGIMIVLRIGFQSIAPEIA